MFKEVYGERVAEWEEPFEAISSQHFFMGGVRIDQECRTTIEGLFAVGEVTGGMHGANRLSGVAFTEIFVLGPVAGRTAASFAGREGFVSPDAAQVNEEIGRLDNLFRQGSGARPFELKAAVQDVMWEKLGPVRDGEGIEAAISAFERIEREQATGMTVGSSDTTYNRDRMEAIELPLMVRTAQLVAHAALLRTESRGSQFRTDFPERNDKEWLRNIVMKKDEHGRVGMRIEKTVEAA